MSQQLKFIASIFKMVLAESYNVMGPETIQTIFRLVGENQGTAIEKRLTAKYKETSWTPEKFAEALIKDVIEPALGEGQADFAVNNGEVTINIKVCPFKAANMKISDKLYCTYTQGMTETAFASALGDIEFTVEQLIADRQPACVFKIKAK